MSDDDNARSQTSPDDGKWTLPLLAILFAILGVGGLTMIVIAMR